MRYLFAPDSCSTGPDLPDILPVALTPRAPLDRPSACLVGDGGVGAAACLSRRGSLGGRCLRGLACSRAGLPSPTVCRSKLVLVPPTHEVACISCPLLRCVWVSSTFVDVPCVPRREGGAISILRTIVRCVREWTGGGGRAAVPPSPPRTNITPPSGPRESKKGGTAFWLVALVRRVIRKAALAAALAAG